MNTAITAYFIIAQAITPSQDNVIRFIEVDSLLNKLAPRFGAPIIADIEGKHRFPESILKLDLETIIDILCGTLRRQLTVSEGVVLLHRKPPTLESGAFGDAASLIAFVSNLSEDQLQRASRGELRIGELSRSERSSLIRHASLTPSLTELLANRPEKIKIGLTYVATYQYKDPKTGRIRGNYAEPGAPAPRKEALPAPNVQVPAGTGDSRFPIKQGSGKPNGGMVFKGEILTLSEVVAKAAILFRNSYAYDYRLKDSTYYLYGDFDLKTLELGLQIVARAEGPAVVASRDEVVRGMIRNAFLAPLKSLEPNYVPGAFSIGELLSERAISGRELGARSPDTWKYLQKIGLTESSTLRLGPGILITIDGGPNVSMSILLREKPK